MARQFDDQTGRSYGTAPKWPSRGVTTSREKRDALHQPRVVLDNLGTGFYRGSKVIGPRRSGDSRVALETLVPHERAYRRSFADEVAIDFPSSRAAIEFFRRDHVEPEGLTPATDVVITISANQAGGGAMVPLDVSVPRTCACCGGRGEVWSEPCGPCDGRGQQLHQQRLTVAVPAGVEHGDRFSFNVSLPRGPRTRVNVRIIFS